MATRIPTGISVTGAQTFGAGDRGSGQQLNPQAVQTVAPARDPGESVSADAFGAAEGRALQNVGGALQGLASVARQLDERRRTADDAAAANAYKFKLNTAYSKAYQEAQAGPTSGTEQFYSRLDQRFQELSSESLKELRDAGYRISTDGEQKIQQIELGLRERYGVSAITFEHNARVKRIENDFKEQLTEVEDAVFTGVSSADDAYSVIEDSLGQFEGIVAPDQVEQLKDTARKRVAIAEWRRLNEGDPEAAKKALGFSEGGSAADIVRSFEGFRTDAYWDVNAHRTGYGSDTVTREDGTVERVNKNTKVSRADAERDLSRRLAEFENIAVKDVGIDAWAALPENARAALISVTYNYGSLPQRVHSAVKSGDLNAIAKAVQSLGGDNGDVNRKRRNKEAAIILGDESIPQSVSNPDERFADIPYEDRLKLNSQADQAIAQQQIQVNDAYRLQIATDPQGTDPQVFLNDTRLDDGDKASLYNSWQSANKEALDRQGAVSWVAGSATANPFDTDDRKRANLAYEGLTAGGSQEQAQQVAEHILARKGVAPKGYLNEVKNGLNSNDVNAVMLSLQRAQRLATISREGLTGAEGGVDVYNAAKDFETMTLGLGYTPEQAAQEYIDDRERAKKAGYDTLVSEAKEIAKDINNADIQSIFGYNALQRSTGFAAEVGYTGAQNAAMLGEYKEFFIDEYTETGNAETAKARADDKMRRLYGTSSMFLDADVITKFPPENYFPTVGGSHDYVASQAANMVEEITGKKYPDSSVFLLADMQQTARDIQSIENGKPVMPRYQLWYVDQDGFLNRAGELDDYFTPDVALGQQMLKEQLRTERAATKAQAEFTEQSTPAEGAASQLEAVRGAAMVGAEDRSKQRAARKAEEEAAHKAVEDAISENLNSSDRRYFR